MSFRDDEASDGWWQRWGVISGGVVAIVAVITLIVSLTGSHGDSPKDNSAAGIADGASAPDTQPNTSITTPASQPTDDTAPASEPTTDSAPLVPPPSPQHVSLQLLCEGQGAQAPQGCDQGTQAVGDQVFSYDMGTTVDVNPGTTGAWEWSLNLPANTCSKLVLRFTPGQGLSDGATVVSAKILQEGPASAIVSAGVGQIKTLTANLNGSPLYLEFKSTSKSAYAWISGYGVCTTDTGFPE